MFVQPALDSPPVTQHASCLKQLTRAVDVLTHVLFLALSGLPEVGRGPRLGSRGPGPQLGSGGVVLELHEPQPLDSDSQKVSLMKSAGFQAFKTARRRSVALRLRDAQSL